ncbi:glycine--tRNA ligase subunit beta [Actinoplanes sp. NPDC049265]|uniref:glycine--tRNA ligase subunit beta n=1 Tax=Actinoplanes sp. NPDC049265 TaxID=3363902 RepID=UPI00371264F2
MLTMQDALARLIAYWTDQGCLTVQPMNTEVGAGTLNPATFLRVLGPEPWRVVYVEPSVRPDDSRYGENPNRIQTHTQVQVILKPEPGDAQELYLGSLAALGIDVAAHDVRFVEDNWASPALGAWGLGWEVWLDGLEITQFTYFQQAGGLNLDPPAVEITYGIERILMALQDVRHFKDIAYADGVTYGEVFGQAEYEMSRYYLDDADIDANRRLLEIYAGEAQRMIDAGLPVPAHTYVLKCSHAFNVLDSRGAVSTAERAAEFGRMRRLAGEVARLWVARREELGHPLGVVEKPAPARAVPATEGATRPRMLAFEVGTEEMPPAAATAAASFLQQRLTELLGQTRLTFGDLRVAVTPRRLIAIVHDVAAREDDRTLRVKGPKVGAPDRALAGFARAQGVEVAALAGEDGYHYAERFETGRAAGAVLAEVLGDVVSGLRSARNMRWNDPELSFTRPIRWLLALLGDDVVPVTVSTLAAGRETRVLRDAAEPILTVASAETFMETISVNGIVADPEDRAELISTGAQDLVYPDGRADLTGLLEQVTHLVEAPNPLLGSFDESYLSLPAEVLTTVMRKHQRYFPVRDADGALLPLFVAVANGVVDVDQVRTGNEAVLRARYEDAAFFYRADLATPPAEMRAKLARLTFTDKLGSMADRADRIGRLALSLATDGDVGPANGYTGSANEGTGPANGSTGSANGSAGSANGGSAGSDDDDLGSDDAGVRSGGGDRRLGGETLERAAQLVKFDLGAQLVTEMTSLAGVMARDYAYQAGESRAVAQALYECELPRSAGDDVPASVPGALLSLADRLDLVAGLAATVGLPTGSSDPFAVRRAVLGLIAVHRAQPALASLSLTDALARAGELQPVKVTPQVLADAGEFLARRLEQQLTEEGHPVDRVRAVLVHADRPAVADTYLAQLSALAGDAAFQALAAALTRARRIVPAGTATLTSPDALSEPADRALWEAVEACPPPADLAGFVTTAGPLVSAVDRFFEDVLVMAEDPALRAARLGLLARVRDLGDPLLDWPQLRL